MSDNESNFIKLEQTLYQLVGEYRNIKKENKSLEEEIKVLKNSLQVSRTQNIELKESTDQLKLTNAMLGDVEHRRLMKVRINKLIKELDICIAQVKNSKG